VSWRCGRFSVAYRRDFTKRQTPALRAFRNITKRATVFESMFNEDSLKSGKLGKVEVTSTIDVLRLHAFCRAHDLSALNFGSNALASEVELCNKKII
jgi:hypothetical protein